MKKTSRFLSQSFCPNEVFRVNDPLCRIGRYTRSGYLVSSGLILRLSWIELAFHISPNSLVAGCQTGRRDIPRIKKHKAVNTAGVLARPECHSLETWRKGALYLSYWIVEYNNDGEAERYSSQCTVIGATPPRSTHSTTEPCYISTRALTGSHVSTSLSWSL